MDGVSLLKGGVASLFRNSDSPTVDIRVIEFLIGAESREFGRVNLTHPVGDVFLALVAAPEIGKHAHTVGWDIAHDFIDRFIIDVPDDLAIVPIETIVMELFRGIEAEIIHIFVMANAVFEVVELDLAGIFA